MSPSRKRPPAGKTPGRPRSTTSRNAILKAAYQILREGGFAGFTVEGVAARAGAGKATIYRWWQSKGTLAIEAFLVAVAPRMDRDVCEWRRQSVALPLLVAMVCDRR